MRQVVARPARLALLAALLLVLAACATQVRRAAPAQLREQERREEVLRQVESWGLVGRIAVDDGDENGSGRIEWRQAGQRFEIVLSAPVSRQSWRLSGGQGWALLEGLEGGPRRASSAAALLAAETGWSVPLDHLRAWARGLRGGDAARLAYGDGPLPEVLDEDGWTVRYRDWFTELQPPLPRRVFAERGDDRVRLVVERWLPADRIGSLPDRARPGG